MNNTVEMPLFDSHLHLDMLVQRGIDVDEAIQKAFRCGMKYMLTIIGTGKDGQYGDSFQMVDEYKNIFMGVGIHPHSASCANADALDRLQYALDRPRVVALGEIGLDYHYNYSAPKEQRQAFVTQLRLAHKRSLPVIVHTRNADEDTMSILKDEGVDELGGVVHCFSATEELAQQALDLGMYISFSGIVTFPKSLDVQNVAQWVPEDKILCETDAPFLSPVPKRGRVNTPENVKHVLEKVATLRGMEPTALAKKVLQNTQNCFGII